MCLESAVMTPDNLCEEAPTFWNHTFRKSLNGKSSRKSDSTLFSDDKYWDPVDVPSLNVEPIYEQSSIDVCQPSNLMSNFDSTSWIIQRPEMDFLLHNISLRACFIHPYDDG
ncbi:hypothetical protein TNCV_923411 [Trichonephila clavipes]|nr:hypothetical protein TNCV_923411 [Trichonephila clavipes]